MSGIDLNDIRDRLRRAKATEEPYDAADQWAALGADVPALLEEVKRLRQRVHEVADEVQRRYAPMESDLVKLRALMREAHDWHAAQMEAEGKPAWSNISGFGAAAAAGILAERDAALKVVHAAEAYRDAHPGGWNDVDLLGAVHNRLIEAVDEWRSRGD